MNKRMAFYVIGAPEQVETREEDGNKVEVWFPRQDRGVDTGFWTSRGGTTGFPSRLEFVKNRLTEIEGASSKVNLDD